jgi:hypothetical protein
MNNILNCSTDIVMDIAHHVGYIEIHNVSEAGLISVFRCKCREQGDTQSGAL